MKKVLLSAIMALGTICAWSQELPEILPPSPEATSLAKFTEVPVSHYTGVPSIGVPLYSINLDGLQIPISLSYHAKGIRVSEVAPRVGIGWALNYGGVISRQTRGKPDDVNGGEGKGYLTQSYYETFHSTETVREDVFADAIVDEADLVPDQFTFNFPGASGKFIFDQKTKAPILQNYEDLEIEVIYKNSGYSIIESWIITNASGFKFYFGQYNNLPAIPISNKEFTLNNYSETAGQLSDSGASSSDTYNSWQLIKIVAPSGRTVDFTYEKENTVYYRRSNDQVHSGVVTSGFSRVRTEEYKIKTITFDRGSVHFVKNTTSRQDLISGGYDLKEVIVKDIDDVEVKKYQLSYSYSNDTNTSNINPWLVSLSNNGHKRLFLDKVEQVSTTGTVLPYYDFDYKDKNSVPNRFSNSQDLWGYYNGKDNGHYLTFFDYGVTSVDRQVDTIKAQAGLLEKITYATGGYSELTYEANRAKSPSYFEEMLFNNMNPSTTQNVGMLKNPLEYVGGGNFEKTFSVINPTVGFMTYTVGFTGNYGTCSTTQHLISCDYQVSIVGINGTSFSGQLYMGTHSDLPALPPGDYKIVVDGVNTDPNDYINAFSVNLSWEELNEDPSEVVFSGGNRIKQIKLNDTEGGIITKSYEYLDTQGETSGLIYSLPSYYFTEHTVNGVQVFDAYGSRPGSPLSYAQGNHAGYSRVTEYIDDHTGSIQGEGGKTEYTFTAMADGGKFYEFPYTVPRDNEWMRGKLLTQKTYEYTNGGFSLVQEVENKYIYTNNTLPNSFNTLTDPLEADLTKYALDRYRFNRPLIAFEGSLGSSDHNDYKTYNLNGGVQKLYSSKQIMHHAAGNKEVESFSFYDFPNHYQLKSTETTDSNGELLKTTNYYYTDTSDLTGYNAGVLSAMGTKNRHDVLETRSYKNGALTSKLRTNLTISGNDFLPSNVQTAKGSASLEERIVYHSYYTNGNVQEVSKTDGTHIVYIWGYDQTVPIAKIENATFSDIPTAVYNDILNASNADNDRTEGATGNEGALRTALQKLRNAADSPNLVGAQITTFTYDPLIGATSMTDSRGRTVYYHYDGFNRLQYVKDHDGNILSENEYNYKN